ncbi:MAG: glycerophosphodiester phosphodiesterase family protein [Steroidobacteraceae bacterium]
MSPPVVIGHRGASGELPEHTLAAYSLALRQGADALETDLVMSRDGALVLRHENELGATTDVARHARFASRRVTKTVDGRAVTGWFSEDFTLQELKSLRARERIPELRPGNSRFDGQFELATLRELLRLRRHAERERYTRAAALGLAPPPPIGLYLELKHPTHFAACGLVMIDALLGELEAESGPAPEAGLLIECFETAILRTLAARTRVPLVQLIEAEGAPYDWVARGEPGGFADLITPAGLARIAAYAACIGPEKSLVIGRDGREALGEPTALVPDSHAQGLRVMPWTFRAENAFLPAEARSSAAAAERGDLARELREFLAAGIDGFFTDHPAIGVQARDAFLSGRHTPPPQR